MLGSADTALELGATQVRVAGGTLVRLSDLAEVRDSVAERRSIERLNGRSAVTFGVSKSRGASDVSTLDRVEAEIDVIKAENPDVSITRVFTTVENTRQSYRSALTAMIEGSVLAVLVVLVFLRDWRSTAISALAIPLAAIPTFAFMYAMDFTLNSISMLALSLVAGVLVDDAIVEIENIVRHMRMGKTGFQAALDAADDAGLFVGAKIETGVSLEQCGELAHLLHHVLVLGLRERGGSMDNVRSHFDKRLSEILGRQDKISHPAQDHAFWQARESGGLRRLDQHETHLLLNSASATCSIAARAGEDDGYRIFPLLIGQRLEQRVELHTLGMRVILARFNKVAILQQEGAASWEHVNMLELQWRAIFCNHHRQWSHTGEDLGEVAFLVLWEMLVNDIGRFELLRKGFEKGFERLQTTRREPDYDNQLFIARSLGFLGRLQGIKIHTLEINTFRSTCHFRLLFHSPKAAPP